jgi:hypothetical protein
MPIIATGTATKERELIPAGTHLATLYKIENLGTRLQEYLGKPKERKDTLVSMTFELPNEMRKFTKNLDNGSQEEVEKPLVISREFVLSMGPKSNLRPFVEGIIGVQLKDEEAYAFDLEDLLGRSCLITVSHKVSTTTGKTYANITSTAPLMKGMEAPKQFNPNKVFDVNTAEESEILALPDFILKKVTISDEYKKRFCGEELTPDDVPF